MESTRFTEIFPNSPLTGWKGSLGHTLGSCGLVELAIAIEAIQAGRSPGTVGSSAPAFTANVALEPFSNREFDAVLCASNAFGGAHAALLLAHD
jgi:3-oxoacyl-(acyl-carrier-protein) synthase